MQQSLTEVEMEQAELYFHDTSTKEGRKIMATLKQAAMDYEPKLTLNIADLENVSIENLEVEEREGTNKDGETFNYQIVKIEGKEYRVPNTVLEEIQKILKLKPSVTKVKVTKSGSGLGTKYKVDALD